MTINGRRIIDGRCGTDVDSRDLLLFCFNNEKLSVFYSVLHGGNAIWIAGQHIE